jgi:RloB-like protein
MSLLNRQPRPIPTRDKDLSSLRDDRLFIIACDDTYAPAQYFGFFRLTRVKIHVVPTPREEGSSVAQYVLQRLLTYDFEEGDERWMLLDTDHVTQGTHLRGFVQALREAANQGVKVALSKPCFELWLLLHHVDETAVTALGNATDVESTLRSVLGEYNKTNLKDEHYPPSSVGQACDRAERLDLTVEGGDIPGANTSRVYQLWKAIASKALPSQLPIELHGLLPK